MDDAVTPGRTDRWARVLDAVRLRSAFYGHAQLTEPGALEIAASSDSISFHVVTAGTCWIRLPGGEPCELRAGDLALVPHGLGHHLASAPAAPSGPRVD